MQIYKCGCDKGGFQRLTYNQTSCYGTQSQSVLHGHLKGLTGFVHSVIFFSKIGLIFLL